MPKRTDQVGNGHREYENIKSRCLNGPIRREMDIGNMKISNSDAQTDQSGGEWTSEISKKTNSM